MYSPPLGRFLSRDPLPQNGGPDILFDNNWFGGRLTAMSNLYGYIDNSPTRDTDPSGMAPANSWLSIASGFGLPEPPLLPLIELIDPMIAPLIHLAELTQCGNCDCARKLQGPPAGNPCVGATLALPIKAPLPK
jgi:RHS repeat-associated protein